MFLSGMGGGSGFSMRLDKTSVHLIERPTVCMRNLPQRNQFKPGDSYSDGRSAFLINVQD
jgi:hypothetical protein